MTRLGIAHAKVGDKLSKVPDTSVSTFNTSLINECTFLSTKLNENACYCLSIQQEKNRTADNNAALLLLAAVCVVAALSL